MYRIAVQDLRTNEIGLVCKDGIIRDFNNLDDAKAVYELMKARLHPSKDMWIFDTNDKFTKANMWNALNTDELVEKLGMLRDRYLDERDNESDKEYVEYAKKNISDRVVKMTKRPFGFVIRCLDGYLHVYVKVQGNYLKTFADNYKGKIK